MIKKPTVANYAFFADITFGIIVYFADINSNIIPHL